jgi:hypothetical protein
MNLENLNPIAIRVDATGGVLVRDESIDFQAWIDVCIHEEDVEVDWNQYIFHLDNHKDVRAREVQKNPEVFMEFTSAAVYKLQELGYIGQDDNAKWSQLKEFGEVWDIDLFEHYEMLPDEVKAVLKKFETMDNSYKECDKLIEALKSIGYTCDYGLDASPFNLKKL